MPLTVNTKRQGQRRWKPFISSMFFLTRTDKVNATGTIVSQGWKKPSIVLNQPLCVALCEVWIQVRKSFYLKWFCASFFFDCFIHLFLIQRPWEDIWQGKAKEKVESMSKESLIGSRHVPAHTGMHTHTHTHSHTHTHTHCNTHVCTLTHCDTHTHACTRASKPTIMRNHLSFTTYC